ncbi:MAG: glycerol-3-phosphate acyltransferase [Chloroflexi bacterium]|nr:glycerol-3-phosphate acyltransferase [Chloroflexota bacterium]
MSWLGICLLSYIIGSIPSAYIAGRLLRGVDIRDMGDGNAGAANVFRELGPIPGIVVGIADTSKGSLAVLLARYLIGSETAVLVAGISAVAGHNWPIYLNFRGGIGAATAMGILLVIIPAASAPLLIIASVPFIATRSTNVFFAFMFAPLALAAWYTGASGPYIGYSIALPIMVGLSHYLSLRRLTPGFPSQVENGLEGSESLRT